MLCSVDFALMCVGDTGVAFSIPTNKPSENNGGNENVQGKRERNRKNILFFNRKST